MLAEGRRGRAGCGSAASLSRADGVRSFLGARTKVGEPHTLTRCGPNQWVIGRAGAAAFHVPWFSTGSERRPGRQANGQQSIDQFGRPLLQSPRVEKGSGAHPSHPPARRGGQAAGARRPAAIATPAEPPAAAPAHCAHLSGGKAGKLTAPRGLLGTRGAQRNGGARRSGDA